MMRKANKYLIKCTEDHQVLHGEKEDQLVPERNRERPLGRYCTQRNGEEHHKATQGREKTNKVPRER
jgi:hypothetical protein